MPHKIRDFPVELQSLLDPRVYRRLQQLYELIYSLQEEQQLIPARTTQAVTSKLSSQLSQLLGTLREPLIGQETVDPFLVTAATVPGTVGTINGLTGNITFVGGSSGFTFSPSLQTITLVSPLITKGDLYAFSTTGTRLPVGTNGQVLTADSAEVTGLKWETFSGAGYDEVQEEGVAVGVGNTIIDFVGAGVTATDAGGGVTEVNIPGGGSGGAPDLVTIWALTD